MIRIYGLEFKRGNVVRGGGFWGFQNVTNDCCVNYELWDRRKGLSEIRTHVPMDNGPVWNLNPTGRMLLSFFAFPIFFKYLQLVNIG